MKSQAVQRSSFSLQPYSEDNLKVETLNCLTLHFSLFSFPVLTNNNALQSIQGVVCSKNLVACLAPTRLRTVGSGTLRHVSQRVDDTIFQDEVVLGA